MSISKDELCDCITIQMGKYTDTKDPQEDVKVVKAFVQALYLWGEFVRFDEHSQWLVVNISYVKDHFFKEDFLSTIKFFMQLNNYSFIKSFDESKPACDDE